MKQILAIILIIVGIISFVKCISPSPWETLGAFIGVCLICFLPAALLFKSSDDD